MGLLPEIELKNNLSVIYSVHSARASFRYLDGRQTADVIGNDMVYIKGGKSETSINFSWSIN
jgi:hypothetical protein